MSNPRRKPPTLPELRALAKQRGLKGYGKLNKRALEALLKRRPKAPPAKKPGSAPQAKSKSASARRRPSSGARTTKTSRIAKPDRKRTSAAAQPAVGGRKNKRNNVGRRPKAAETPPSAPRLYGYLHVVLGRDVGSATRLPEVGECVIGRSLEASVQLNDPLASRLHAGVQRKEDDYWIRDLGSKNGTFVADRRIAEAVLKDGDYVRIGSTEFQFRMSSVLVRSSSDFDPHVTHNISRVRYEVVASPASEDHREELQRLGLSLEAQDSIEDGIRTFFESLRETDSAIGICLTSRDRTGSLWPSYVFPVDVEVEAPNASTELVFRNRTPSVSGDPVAETTTFLYPLVDGERVLGVCTLICRGNGDRREFAWAALERFAAFYSERHRRRAREKTPDFRRETRWDVFISHKRTDGRQALVRDVELAREVYDRLTADGLRTFLSSLSLQELGVADYKREIDRALDQSEVLVAVGTSVEHLESKWVRYEWDSFYNDILSGIKPQGRVFVYVDQVEPRLLPRALRTCEVIEHERGGATRLLDFIHGGKRNRPSLEGTLINDPELNRAAAQLRRRSSAGPS